jgi:hypothetical protein
MMLIEMLSSMKRYFMAHLEDSLSMLRALEDSKQTNL